MKRDSTIAVAFHAKAVAVMLYFMQPLRPAGTLVPLVGMQNSNDLSKLIWGL